MMRRALILIALLVVFAACAQVYVVTGNESKITTEREVSQTIGRQRIVNPEQEQPEESQPKPKEPSQ